MEFFSHRLLTPEVAETALKALVHDRPVAVMRMRGVGLLYRASLIRSVLPRRTRLRLSARFNRRFYGAGGDGGHGGRPISGPL